MPYFNTRDAVARCLEEKPKARDSDNALFTYVILDNESKVGILTAMQLLENIYNGKYGSFESITRARRKIQEQNEALRGERWKQRHAFQEDVKKELGEW